MDRPKHTYSPEDGVAPLPQEQLSEAPHPAALNQPYPVQTASSNPYTTSSHPNYTPDNEHSQDSRRTDKIGITRPNDPIAPSKRINKKWQRRLYWIVPLCIIAIVLVVLFEVYKSDFQRWCKPLTDWLRAREAWSWVIPVVILFCLSFPPLFGHEIVQIIVGLTYPLGVAIGIACAGSILGEAGCFIVFKYFATSWVERKIAAKIKWAATARIAQEAGYRGVLVIRYSIIPPHLANPLFACTGMKFWIYMTTVILSLPKSIIFVALGSPTSENSKGAKWAKVVAIGVVVIISLFASIWIRKKMTIAIKEIEVERGISRDDEELAMLGSHMHVTGTGDTSYRGGATAPSPYQGAAGLSPYQHSQGIDAQRPGTFER